MTASLYAGRNRRIGMPKGDKRMAEYGEAVSVVALTRFAIA